MMKILLLLFAISMMIPTDEIVAQALNNAGVERFVNSDRYFRLNYSNDYFTAKDDYLTQAFQFELALPVLSKIPIYKVIYRPSNSEVKFGLSLEHNAYTPVHYQRYEVQQGDRPFAATFFMNIFAISTNITKRQKWSSRLTVGILGPGAFGNEMQTYIHEKTNNATPQGWHNQIRNDVILNYEVTYQKQLFDYRNILLLTADGMARIGTLSTKANVGATLMLGYFNSPFASIHVKGRKISFYGYDHPEVNAVAYDATLQGGLLNHSSIYTIPSADISRFVFVNNWGLVMQIGRLYLEYYQSYMTKEFSTAMSKRNGGIQIGYSF